MYIKKKYLCIYDTNKQRDEIAWELLSLTQFILELFERIENSMNGKFDFVMIISIFVVALQRHVKLLVSS